MKIYSIKIIMANKTSHTLKVKSDSSSPEDVIKDILKLKFIKTSNKTYVQVSNICDIIVDGGQLT